MTTKMTNNTEKIMKLLAEVRELTGSRSQYELEPDIADACLEKLEKAEELYLADFDRLVKAQTGWEN